jgi:hypothetical protein
MKCYNTSSSSVVITIISSNKNGAQAITDDVGTERALLSFSAQIGHESLHFPVGITVVERHPNRSVVLQDEILDLRDLVKCT